MERKFKVIVVDDEKLIARNIARNIEKLGEAFEVVSIAGSGQEAYELAKELMPDIVFSDIKMPEMDGLELIDRINKELPAIKTVIVSGYHDFELACSALRSHATDYLLKPVNPCELRRTLHRLEAELMAEQNELSPRREDDLMSVVECVMAYLRQNCAEPIDFSEIAVRQGFSASYLSKIFREQINTTPGKYLSDYRMQMARKLLKDTELSVKEVAIKVGFADPFHFSKNFKAATGLSPAQFRDAPQESRHSNS